MNNHVKIADVIQLLNSWAPSEYQEGYDNSGLIVGNQNTPITGVLVSLDCTEDVVEEAIKNNCNLIVSHHPIVFSGLKRLTGQNYVERTVIKAIKHDVAIFAIHTNLDHVNSGVNKMIGDKLQIQNKTILNPKKALLYKLKTFVPIANKTQVLEAMFRAGAGKIGNYDSCSFSTSGTGTFKATKGANPFVGKLDELHIEKEEEIGVIVSKPALNRVKTAMISAHPYEEPAYDLVQLENANNYVGSGMVGELAEPMDVNDFLQQLKNTFNCGVVKYTKPISKQVKRIAWCGGSGSFLLNNAKAARADVYITADFKYHEYFDADGQIMIADIGHFESEQFTKDLIVDFLEQNFSTFAIRLSEVNTNPINYL